MSDDTKRKKTISSQQAKHAIFKIENKIKELCSTINTLDLARGGNGRKVVEDDYLEDIGGIKSFIESRKN